MRASTGRSLLLVLLLALPAAAAQAQIWMGPAALEVRAEDNGKPAAGGEVRLEYLDMEPSDGPAPVPLDSRGKAVIGSLAEGHWRLEVSRPGAMTYRAEILVRAGGKPQLINAVQHNVPGAVTMMEVKLAKARGGAAPAPRSEPARQEPAAATPRPEPAQPARAEPARPAPAPIPPAPQPEPQPQPQSQPQPQPQPQPIPREEAPAPAPQPVVTPPPAPAPAPVEREAPTPAPEPAPKTPEPRPEPRQEAPAPQPVTPPPAPAPVPVPKREAPTPAPTPAPPAPQPEPKREAPPPIRPAAPPQRLEPAPAPQPATPPPAAAEPAPAPVPPGATLRRSAQDRTCAECKPGESSLSVEVVAPPAAGATGCGSGLREALLRRDVTGLPAGCQMLRLELPPNARYIGYRYEIRDGGTNADCQAGKDCSSGDARWPMDPLLFRDGTGKTTVSAAFENRSADRERRAVLTVYFKEAGNPNAPRPMLQSRPGRDRPPG